MLPSQLTCAAGVSTWVAPMFDSDSGSDSDVPLAYGSSQGQASQSADINGGQDQTQPWTAEVALVLELATPQESSQEPGAPTGEPL